MNDLIIEVKITHKEYLALSFFRHEVSGNFESSASEKYQADLMVLFNSCDALIQRLQNSKSKKIAISVKDMEHLNDLRYETAGKIEGCSDESYVADFEYHDKRFTSLKNKFYKAKAAATVVWALELARQKGLPAT